MIDFIADRLFIIVLIPLVAAILLWCLEDSWRDLRKALNWEVVVPWILGVLFSAGVYGSLYYFLTRGQ
jgi:hypothetical protein